MVRGKNFTRMVRPWLTMGSLGMGSTTGTAFFITEARMSNSKVNSRTGNQFSRIKKSRRL